MNVRERLTELSKLDRLIDCKIVQHDRIRKVPLEEFCTDKVKALAEEINADIDRLVDEKRAIMQVIDNTPELTDIELEILYKHYLEGKSYEKIAKEVHYTKTTVFRTCVKAVDKVARRWSDT